MPGTTVEESASGMMDISAIYEDVDEPENRSTEIGVMLYMVARLEDMGSCTRLIRLLNCLKKQEGYPCHPDTLEVYSNLAATYDAMGAALMSFKQAHKEVFAGVRTKSIELKHEVEALRGQLAATTLCRTNVRLPLASKEAYLTIRLEVEERKGRWTTPQEERERRTSAGSARNRLKMPPSSSSRVTLPHRSDE
ncbi:hypothetical protein IFM89_011814 [Coptis chinensis]|uniref:Uncharacterized protein n=1 Tax=Coptis chinensis TaxID=261450 RepID=A0A835H319_9MAGN|nr:hypothetical protein IFM89_011814 [Coptis chinensis]